MTSRRSKVPPVADAYLYGRWGVTEHPVITWVLSRRRSLKLQPVNYEWSGDAYAVPGALSTGGFVVVQNAEWADGAWRSKR